MFKTISETTLEHVEEWIREKWRDHHHCSSPELENQENIHVATVSTISLTSPYELSFHDLDDLRKVDMYCRYQSLLGRKVSIRIAIRDSKNYIIPHSAKQVIRIQLEKFGLGKELIDNCIVFMDEKVEPYYNSFIRFGLRELYSRGRIEKVEAYVSDLNLQYHTMTLLKLFVNGPYPEFLQPFQDKKVYVAAYSIDGSSMIGTIGCQVCETQEYGLYETIEKDELIICDPFCMKNLCRQRMTPISGQFNQLLTVVGSQLVGLVVTSQIFDYDLIISPVKMLHVDYSGFLLTCLVNETFNSEKFGKEYWNELVIKSKRGCEKQRVYSLIQSELMESFIGSETILNESIPQTDFVIVHLDELKESRLNSMLRSKLSENLNYSDHVTSLLNKALTKKGLAITLAQQFDGRYYREHTVSLKDKWAIMLSDSKWKKFISGQLDKSIVETQILKSIHNVQVILGQQVNGSEMPWEGKEFSDPNWLRYFTMPSFFVTCEELSRIGIPPYDLNYETWKFIYNFTDHYPYGCKIPQNVLKNLQTLVKNLEVEYLIGPLSQITARHCFVYSFFHSKLPKHVQTEQFTYYTYRYRPKVVLNWKRLMDNNDKWNSNPDGVRVALSLNNHFTTFLHDLHVFYKKSFQYMNRCEYSTRERTNDSNTLSNGFFEKLFLARTKQYLALAKLAYEKNDERHVVYIWFKMKSHFKSYLNHKSILNETIDSDTCREALSYQLIILNPIAPYLTEYIWCEILRKSTEEMRWPKICENLTEDLSIVKQFEYLLRIQKRISKLSKKEIVIKVIRKYLDWQIVCFDILKQAMITCQDEKSTIKYCRNEFERNCGKDLLKQAMGFMMQQRKEIQQFNNLEEFKFDEFQLLNTFKQIIIQKNSLNSLVIEMQDNDLIYFAYFPSIE